MRELEVSEFLAALRHGIANTSLYPADHPQAGLAVDILTERAGALTVGSDEVVLSLIDNAFYLDKHLLPQASLEFRELFTTMNNRGLESVSISNGATPGDLREFAAFISSGSGDIPAEGTVRLNERPYSSAELKPIFILPCKFSSRASTFKFSLFSPNPNRQCVFLLLQHRETILDN